MKTSRIPQRPTEVFGLFAIIASKRVILPLKGVECDFSVLSGLAEVSMTQIFRQENDRALDCEYQFPLPADASVFACEADINGRVIRAQVRERQEARQLAAEKKAAGFRTALVESERDNLFTLSLGNVQPDDLVVIRLKYFQTVRALADTQSIEIPFCPGVRYIPGKPLLRSNRGKGVVDDTNEVPDASRISPVRIDAGHPDAAYIEVRGTLDGKFVAADSLTSPSHPVTIDSVENQLRVSLSDKGDVPDRDFVLRWTERAAEAVAPRVWLRQHGAESYALMEVRAPKTASGERSPIDFYFLVDRSGSMSGKKWKKAVEALQSCLRVLGSADRAMVTFFESNFEDFAEGPLPVPDLLRDRQFQTISRLGTAGGTEMQPALAHVLEVAARDSRNRDKNLILITDAQVGNESAILDLMKNAPDLPVHCFGIDIALNDALLLALCRQQGGTFHSLNPNDDIQKAVSSLGQTLGSPVLLDLKLSDGWELADAKIPNLYAGQVHYLSARSTNGQPLELAARTATSQTVKIEFEKQATQVEAPYLHWCRSRIQRLVAEGDEQGAVALSVQSSLICPLTAFIAWDESEKVTVANHELVQPSMELCCEMSAPRGAGPTGTFRSRSAPAVSLDALYDASAEFASPPPMARRSGGLFRRILQAFDGSPEQGDGGPLFLKKVKKAVDLDELALKRELSDLCHRLAVENWPNLIKAIFDWIAAAKDGEHSQRIAAVNELLRGVQPPARAAMASAGSKNGPMLLTAARNQIQTRLQSFIQQQQIRTS